jgi:RNA polymerase sigma factor (sigma-70 family)
VTPVTPEKVLPPLTELHLAIPAAIARKYRLAGQLRGLSVEELESEGALALVQAWGQFDPARSPAGAAGLGGYLAQRVDWKVRNLIWPTKRQLTYAVRGRASTRSLDASLPERMLVASGADPGAAVAVADEVEALRQRSAPRDWTILVLRYCDDLTLEQVSQRLGVTKERVRQIEARAIARLRRKNEEVTTC